MRDSIDMMIPCVQLLPGATAEILASVADTGVLTLGDRYGLMAATLDESLDEEERRSVDRLIRRIVRGRVKVDSDRVSSMAI